MKLKQLLISTVLMLPLSAQAVVLTFDDVVSGGEYNPYSSSGFTVQGYYYYGSANYAYRLYGNLGQTSTFNQGQNYLVMNHGTDGAATIVSDTGDLFSVNSLKLGSTSRYWFVDITVTGLDANGDVVKSVTFNSMKYLQSQQLEGFTDISILEITAYRPDWDTSYSFSFDDIDITETNVAPQLSCTGFDAPMDNGAVKAKKNRVLPLKAELFDGSNSIDAGGIISAPVLTVMYNPGLESAEDISADALAAGEGTDGNQFEYNWETNQWRFNLKTKNYTAAGTYNVSLISGDAAEYGVDPACEASFVIQ